MQRNNHHNCVVGAITVALLLAGTVFARAQSEDQIEKSFNVGVNGKLVMDVDRGSIEVNTVDRNTLDVQVIRKVTGWGRVKGDDVLRHHQVELTQEGNDVRIRAQLKGNAGGLWNLRGRNLNVRYIISAPKKYNVDLKTSGGGISVSDLNGTVRARTSGGSLRFGQIQGPVWGRTSGGGISLDGCQQPVDVETSGGSITVGNVEAPVIARTSGGSIKISKAKGNVLAKTSGGGITVNEVLGTIEASTSGGSVSARLSHQPPGDCTLKTSGGSIDVQLAPAIAVNLDASTSGGRVITEIPVTVQGEIKKTALKSKINGGGPALLLHTSGGNVHIRKL